MTVRMKQGGQEGFGIGGERRAKLSNSGAKGGKLDVLDPMKIVEVQTNDTVETPNLRKERMCQQRKPSSDSPSRKVSAELSSVQVQVTHQSRHMPPRSGQMESMILPVGGVGCQRARACQSAEQTDIYKTRELTSTIDHAVLRVVDSELSSERALEWSQGRIRPYEEREQRSAPNESAACSSDSQVCPMGRAQVRASANHCTFLSVQSC